MNRWLCLLAIATTTFAGGGHLPACVQHAPDTGTVVNDLAKRATPVPRPNGAQEPEPEPEPSRPQAAIIEPARSLGTGLLLEAPLNLDAFSKTQFIELMNTVGPEKINRPWTSPLVRLPDRPSPRITNAAASGSDLSPQLGLTETEIKAYMQTAKRLFGEGKSVPVSDVGLISTQEDVIRRPMLNHIAAFENSEARVYLLVQKTSTDHDWGYFSIVQDMTVDPPLDYYGQIMDAEVNFEGTSCYKCHSSGPLAIHPAREDLVLDAKLAAALNEVIAGQPRSRFHFPADSPRPASGSELALPFCTDCHSADGDRSPLFQVHSHPIRVLVDFGYMPPGGRLTAAQIAELKQWLETK